LDTSPEAFGAFTAERCEAIHTRAEAAGITVNHAALVSEGIDGFIDQMGLARCEEVRVADSHGRYEEHLPPGEGQIDFRQLFRRIEQDPQLHGHYMCAFGSLEVVLTGRAYLAQEAAAALG
jgi:sugar phosphate isomerase/epimerase